MVPRIFRLARRRLSKEPAGEVPSPGYLDLFVIASDESAWDNLMALSGHAGSSRVIFGPTNPDNHSPLLRGTALFGKDKVMTPEHLVAHELAHISLQSSDERRVEDRALDWIKADRKQPILRQSEVRKENSCASTTTRAPHSVTLLRLRQMQFDLNRHQTR